MPIYNYKCSECETIIEANHSMTECLTDCEMCSTINSLKKLPNKIAVKYNDGKTGKVVQDFIEQTKKDLDAEKEMLKTKEWTE